MPIYVFDVTFYIHFAKLGHTLTKRMGWGGAGPGGRKNVRNVEIGANIHILSAILYFPQGCKIINAKKIRAQYCVVPYVAISFTQFSSVIYSYYSVYIIDIT